jgi:archaellum component FlaC
MSTTSMQASQELPAINNEIDALCSQEPNVSTFSKLSEKATSLFSKISTIYQSIQRETSDNIDTILDELSYAMQKIRNYQKNKLDLQNDGSMPGRRKG